MEFTKLSQLAAAKAKLREQGYSVKSADRRVEGRKAFSVENDKMRIFLSDYGLLIFASKGTSCLVAEPENGFHRAYP